MLQFSLMFDVIVFHSVANLGQYQNALTVRWQLVARGTTRFLDSPWLTPGLSLKCKLQFGSQSNLVSLRVHEYLCERSVKDKTRTGHVLGDARTRTEVPERNLSPAQSRILRLLTHLAMFQGAVINHHVRLVLPNQ